jgi:hypothetical protein
MTHALNRRTSRTAAPVARSAQYAGTAVAVGAVWLAVVLVSVFSPDLVHGSEHEHLPIAAILTWFWGALATAFLLVPLAVHRRTDETRPEWWFVLAAATSAVWTAVIFVSIFAPNQVTGSDPTRVPVGAMLSPVIGMVATAFVAGFVTIFIRSD